MAGDRVAPAERGSSTIADRVVAKIAAQAAKEALDGVPEGGKAPTAMVTVHHGSARVRIGLELDYPADIGARCGEVRGQVAQRVQALAGMEVREVEVRVERLHSLHSRRSNRGGIR
jgi:uncharacterized alkaline shock family protein YloU